MEIVFRFFFAAIKSMRRVNKYQAANRTLPVLPLFILKINLAMSVTAQGAE